jgi:hypothetical protein
MTETMLHFNLCIVIKHPSPPLQTTSTSQMHLHGRAITVYNGENYPDGGGWIEFSSNLPYWHKWQWVAMVSTGWSRLSLANLDLVEFTITILN